MGKLKLTVNETKTRVCKLPEEKFDFLGYTFGRCYSPQTGRAYLGTVPSKKRVNRICEAISSETGRNTTLLDAEAMVGQLNRKLNGWANWPTSGSGLRVHARLASVGDVVAVDPAPERSHQLSRFRTA